MRYKSKITVRGRSDSEDSSGSLGVQSVGVANTRHSEQDAPIGRRRISELTSEEMVELRAAELRINLNKTLLIAAQWRDNGTRIRELVNLGANNLQDSLLGAAEIGSEENIKTLKELGADINAKYRNDNTILMIAASDGHEEAVRALIEMEADINAKNNDNKTALTFATLEGQFQVVKLLMEAKAKIGDKPANSTLIFAKQGLANLPNSVSDLLYEELIIKEQAILKAINLIITSVASIASYHSKDNQKEISSWDWIQNNELRDDEIQNCLYKETIIFLAAILPENELRTQIIEKFSADQSSISSDSYSLNQEDKIKIAQLRILKDFLPEFLFGAGIIDVTDAKINKIISTLYLPADIAESRANEVKSLKEIALSKSVEQIFEKIGEIFQQQEGLGLLPAEELEQLVIKQLRPESSEEKFDEIPSPKPPLPNSNTKKPKATSVTMEEVGKTK